MTHATNIKTIMNQLTKTLCFYADTPTIDIFTDSNGRIEGRGGAIFPELGLLVSIPLITKHSRCNTSMMMLWREWEMIYHTLRLIIGGGIPGYDHIVVNGKPFWGFIRSCNIVIYTDNQTVVNIFNKMIIGSDVGHIYADKKTILEVANDMHKLFEKLPFMIEWISSHKEDHILDEDKSYYGWGNAYADKNCNGLPDGITTAQGFEFSGNVIGREHHVDTDVPDDPAHADIYYAMNPHLVRIPKFNFDVSVSEFTI